MLAWNSPSLNRVVPRTVRLSVVYWGRGKRIFHDNALRHMVPYRSGCDESGADAGFLTLRTSIAHQFQPHGLEECYRPCPFQGGRGADVLIVWKLTKIKQCGIAACCGSPIRSNNTRCFDISVIRDRWLHCLESVLEHYHKISYRGPNLIIRRSK